MMVSCDLGASLQLRKEKVNTGAGNKRGTRERKWQRHRQRVTEGRDRKVPEQYREKRGTRVMLTKLVMKQIETMMEGLPSSICHWPHMSQHWIT